MRRGGVGQGAAPSARQTEGAEETDRSLYDVYTDAMMEEPLDLPAFLRRVEGGSLGRFTPEDVRGFLREVERDIIGNIHAMTEAHPHLTAEVEERVEETRHMIADLSRRYGSV